MKLSHSIVSMAGVLISQVLFFSAIYLIGKFFGPAFLGDFNSKLSLASFLGGISALRLELACVDNKSQETQSAFLAAFLTSIVFHTITLCFVFLGLVSLSVIAFSFVFFISQLATQYYVTKRSYTLIALLKIFTSAFFIFLLVIKGKLNFMIRFPSFDLYLISISVTVFLYLLLVSRDGLLFWKIRRGFFSENIHFPKYILPASVFSGFITYGLAIIFPIYFGNSDAGYFALAYRIGSFPVTLGAQSIGAVIRRDAVEAVSKGPGSLRLIFITYLKLFILFAIVYLTCGYVLSTPVINYVFGPTWSKASEFLKVMLPLFTIQLCYVSLSQIFLATRKQKLDMYLQFFMGGVMSAVIVLAGILGWSALETIQIYTLVGLISTSFSLYFVINIGLEKYKVGL